MPIISGGSGGGGSPTGAAGGDLSGTYPNPALAAAGGGAAGPIGSTSAVPVVTVDAKGRVTALTSASPTVATLTAPAGALAMNTQKITGLAAGSANGDAVRYEQSPAGILTTTGDLIYASAANTPARLAIGATGQVVSVIGGVPAMAYPPGYELNYTQRTTNVAIASTTESSGTAVLSPGAVTFPGTAVLVEFFAILAQLPSAAINNQVIVSLFESTTQLTRLAAANTQQISAFDDLVLYGRYRFTPSAGSHTYSVTAFATSTTGTPTIIAGSGGTSGFAPCFVRFTIA